MGNVFEMLDILAATVVDKMEPRVIGEIGGIKIAVSPYVRAGEVVFADSAGKPVARITNLGDPDA